MDCLLPRIMEDPRGMPERQAHSGTVPVPGAAKPPDVPPSMPREPPLSRRTHFPLPTIQQPSGTVNPQRCCSSPHKKSNHVPGPNQTSHSQSDLVRKSNQVSAFDHGICESCRPTLTHLTMPDFRHTCDLITFYPMYCEISPGKA
jgi:hypothetical protein